MTRATSLLVVANRHCPHCLHALDTVTDWAAQIGLPVAAVDAEAHPELCERHAVETSPLLLFEERGHELARPGMPTHEEFLQLVDRV